MFACTFHASLVSLLVHKNMHIKCAAKCHLPPACMVAGSSGRSPSSRLMHSAFIRCKQVHTRHLPAWARAPAGAAPAIGPAGLPAQSASGRTPTGRRPGPVGRKEGQGGEGSEVKQGLKDGREDGPPAG